MILAAMGWPNAVFLSVLAISCAAVAIVFIREVEFEWTDDDCDCKAEERSDE